MQTQKNKQTNKRASPLKNKQAKASPRGARPMATVPVAMSRKTRGYAPAISQGGDSVVIRHSEFICDIAGSTAFATTSLNVNPGIATTFPWLSSVAMRYQRYQFRNLKFRYQPRCSTATAGTVILAIDYDANDAAPLSKSAVLSYYGCDDSAAWQECCCGLDARVARDRGSLFLRAGTLAANQDVKTFDLGTLYVCTSGFAGATACGELYVEYDCCLLIPQTTPVVLSKKIDASAGLNAGALYGTNAASTGLINVTVTDASTLTFNQEWSGLCELTIVGTGLAGTIANTGTASGTIQGTFTVNAGGTYARGLLEVVALRGQTLVLGITATAVTGITHRFSQYDTAL